ncbi:MAG: DUF393 domain-containing protein [Pseudobacteriovorax sp.]|nr:DUF393 domain-containing protein [Pseudobacteriovorax sp.]
MKASNETLQPGSKGQPILVLFDGVCTLCNGAVDFIVKRSSPKSIQLAPLQGETAKRLLANKNIPDSIIAFKNGEMLFKSKAATTIGLELGGLWAVLSKIANGIPKPWADLVYDWVARHRYRIWGKRDTCRIPSPEEKEFFLP